MKHLLLLITSLSLISFSSFSIAEEEPSLVTTKRLTMHTALMIAQGAVAECTKRGIQISVTVVDREGITQVVLRDTIAAQISLPISKDKAFTAANFNAASGSLGDLANSPVGRVSGLVMSAGGLPIEVGGSLVGAIGVSGAPSGVTDAECAQAGIDTVIDDLEMSM